MNKRGITLSTLVAIILLILAFGILLFFIINLNLSQRTDREACKQSVIMRGTIASLPVLDAGKSYAPLQCKEKKVCITNSVFGNCEEFTGEKGVEKVIVKDKEGIEKVISQEILECWNMMGQGRLDLFSQFIATRYGFGLVYPSCIICSRIAIDERISLDEIKKVNVQEYMATHAVPGKSVSYYTYMLGNDISAGEDFAKISFDVLNNINYKKDIEKITKEEEEQVEIEFVSNETKNNIINNSFLYVSELSEDTNSEKESSLAIDQIKYSFGGELPEWNGEQLAIVFMQISAPKVADSLMNLAKLGGLMYGGSFVLSPRNTISFTKSCLTNPYCLKIAFVLGGVIAGAQQVNVAYNRHVSMGYCGDVSSSSKNARSGCSVVRVVKYEPQAINTYCSGNIESIP
ncbi:MAG: hypothetical protein QW117_01045 [Candidatus Pacearchaeota archaeon]